jgi:dTDP-4-amino-4,6-dideoxygalactose transaminase
LTFIRPPTEPKGYQHAYQSYVCLFGADQIDFGADDLPDRDLVDELNRDRNRLMARLESEGISVRQGTHAVHTLGYYRNRYALDAWDYPRSYIADRLSITLPLYAQIKPSEQERLVDAIQRLHDRE